MEFLASDIRAITGVKRNRLQAWLERSFLVPSIQRAEGHGSRNIWSLEDLYRIAIFKKVTERGLSREIAAGFLSKGIAGKKLSTKELNGLKLLVYFRKDQNIGVHAVVYPENSSEKDWMPKFDMVTALQEAGFKSFDDMYIINFVQIRNDVDAKIKELKSKS